MFSVPAPRHFANVHIAALIRDHHEDVDSTLFRNGRRLVQVKDMATRLILDICGQVQSPWSAADGIPLRYLGKDSDDPSCWIREQTPEVQKVYRDLKSCTTSYHFLIERSC